MFDNLLVGFTFILNPINFLIVILGIILGIIVGILMDDPDAGDHHAGSSLCRVNRRRIDHLDSLSNPG
jgi:hypothetical protein